MRRGLASRMRLTLSSSILASLFAFTCALGACASSASQPGTTCAPAPCPSNASWNAATCRCEAGDASVDAGPLLIHASDYDQSCKTADDCVAIAEGNVCAICPQDDATIA